MDIQIADSRPPTVSNGLPRRGDLQTAAEFHTLSLQIGEADGRSIERRRRVFQSLRRLPRWRELLYTLVPIFTAHQQRERDEQQREAAYLQVADDMRLLTYHLLEVDELLMHLGTSPVRGLEGAAVERRIARHGPNSVSPPSRRVVLRVFSWFFAGFNRFLWVAMVVFFLCWKPIGNPPQSGNLALAIVIVFVICLQASFSAWQEWITHRAMHSISSMVTAETTALRDGARVRLPQRELVPGDMVFLQPGDLVPADIRLVDVSLDLLLDRSALSGAPDPTIGTTGYTSTNYLETRNMAMMGAHVAQGQLTGVVVATGDRTVVGRISQLVMSKPPGRTILQIEVHRLVNWLTTVSLAVGTLFVLLWAVWLRPKYPGFMSVSDALANGVGVLVTFVPGGLPISLILAMVIIAKRMQRAQLLVKNLTTIETLGTVNVICCEKTGTVTQRRMVPRRLGFADEAVELAGPMSGHVDGSGDPALRRVFETAALCNAARFDPLSAQLPVDEREALGDATDCALLRLAEHLRPQLGRDEPQYSRLLTIPFSLRRRWMLTVCKADSGPPFVLVKGAPETLLPRCSQVQTRSGALVPLSAEMRARLEGMQRNWATSDGCRVLLLCRRDFDSSSNGGVAANPLAELEDKPAALHALASQSVEDLTVVGLVGLVDPPRDEILDSVGRLHRAGVRVFMVTGDYAPTAAHVARQCGMITGATVDGIREAMARAAFGFSDKQPAGATADAALDRHSTAQPACCPQPPGVPRRRLSIADSDHTLASRTALVVSGPELPGLRSEHWDAVLSYDECVFARITPEQKLQIVEEMRARGLIVAVTGDEVNDVPAMQAAHVGVAMGNGTEVAKEAAEMVLVDNNFASLLVAIESGRLLFVNLKKVIVYLLPMTNLSEIVPSLLNVVLGLPIPLSTFLMLVINTVTDVWASVLLAYEEPETDLMLHAPRDPAVDGLVNVRFFVQAYGFVGLVQTLTGHVMFFLCLYLRGGIGPGHVFLAFNKWTDGYQGKTREQLAQLVSMAGSAHFMALVVMQWANMFVARTRVLSVFRQNPLWGPRSNPLLLVAVPISVAVALFFNEIGWFNRVFLTGRIPVEFFFLPIPFAVALLVLEELRKLAVRRYPSGVIARIAW